MAQRNHISGAGVASKDATAFKEEKSMPDEEIISSKFQNEPQLPNYEQDFYSYDADFCLDSLLFESSEEIRKPGGMRANSSDAVPTALFKIFAEYDSRVKRFNEDQLIVASTGTQHVKTVDKKLSTNAIIRFASEKFIQSLESSDGDLLMAGLLFSEQFSSLDKEDARDAELVYYILASAEKLVQKQFDHARKLLDRCDELCSCEGNPVQRLVFYFSKALKQKIDEDTMKTRSLNFWKNQLWDVEEELTSLNSAFLAVLKAIPAGLIVQLAGVQTIMDHVTEARKIHIIDFSIKAGLHHSMLIQALVTQSKSPLEHLKITAVATKSKQNVDETGNRLRCFAQSLNLAFSFNVVMVEDLLDLEEGFLSVDLDETVIVYSAYFFLTMLAQPDRLESLMRVIKNTKPCVMIVAEIEANLNSPIFVSRFTETLFFYGAQFDSLGECLKNDEANRFNLESLFFSKSIYNTVAAEGERRRFRKVKVEVWRAFFERFGMVQTSLGMSSFFQANLVLKDYPYASSCTLNMDGECLIIGWKETTLYSVSAWRFK